MTPKTLRSGLQAGRLGLSPDKAATRRVELRQILSKACALVKRRDLELVLLPGDLFDDEAATQDTINFVIDHLAGLAPVPVAIAPGNHDYYSLGSPYNNDLLMARKQRPWPDNVHIFKDGRWSSHVFAGLPGVRITGMAHSANAALTERLLARRVPREGSGTSGAGDPIEILIFHGSRDCARIPARKLRTLPFSDSELTSQGFDYAAVGHYHSYAAILGPGGRIAGAYAGCPSARGLDEEGEKVVLVGEIQKDLEACQVSLETVRVDRRSVSVVEVNCTGATHREAILRRVEEALLAKEPAPEDLVQIRLAGRIAPGIDPRMPEGVFEDRYFHVSLDLSRLKPDYNLERYRDERLKTTEARFAREMLAQIDDAELDPARRRLLENALYYGLDALIQKEVSPRYED